MLEQQPDDRLVAGPPSARMIASSSGGPAQAVDVVHIDAVSVQQVAHDLHVPASEAGMSADAAEAVRDRRVGARHGDERQDVEQALGAGVRNRLSSRRRGRRRQRRRPQRPHGLGLAAHGSPP